MTSLVATRGMLRADLLRLVRDRFLLGMIVYILSIGLVVRLFLPWVTAELLARLDFDLTPYYVLLSSHLVVGLAGLLAGIVTGLLLMDGRESGTVRAQRVSPVPPSQHALVIGAATLLAATVFSLVQGLIFGIGLPSPPAFVLTCLMAAPAAVSIAFFIAAFSTNKTEAFVYLKVCALLPMIPSAAWFLPEPWQWVAGVHPTYFAAKAWWIAAEGGGAWLPWALGAVPVGGFWMWLTGRLYLRAVES